MNPMGLLGQPGSERSSCILEFSFPGCFSLQGPESVSGSEEGSVTVQCHYDTGWETHRKWWCQGKIWNFCKILIQSRGSEQEVKKDRMSIRDNHRNRSFTVTMEKLSREDADTYWCGIEKKGSDLGVQVKVTVGPALGTAGDPPEASWSTSTLFPCLPVANTPSHQSGQGSCQAMGGQLCPQRCNNSFAEPGTEAQREAAAVCERSKDGDLPRACFRTFLRQA
ncbi:CMRF35-like molecule 7 isoform X3 [Elephas maximus indicus]|uniref:CMRF35-like molecule 7 isoform X3 n=1 Tax=Elephas maximus indicus TaxID=99487 RepID=UPI0021163ECA|nr:CMRF35-like molecule 7 isoform X3 [Elephas maximus indicus]